MIPPMYTIDGIKSKIMPHYFAMHDDNRLISFNNKNTWVYVRREMSADTSYRPIVILNLDVVLSEVLKSQILVLGKRK